MLKRGAVAKSIHLGDPRPLSQDDLARLAEGNRTSVSTPQRLRDSHHRIARLAASGLKTVEVARRAGYTPQRVGDLLNSPAMEELVARYREKIDEAFVESQDEYFELATSNMLAAERHIADQIAELDEANALLPIRTALAISRDAADRFGYGKRQTNTNVNVDFAALLEKRISNAKVLDPSVVAQPQQARHVSSLPRPTPMLVEPPQPSIRRRA